MYADLFRDASNFEFLPFSYFTNEHGRCAGVIYSVGENTKDESSTVHTLSNGMPKMLNPFRQFLAIIWLFHRIRAKTSPWVRWDNFKMITGDVHGMVVMARNVQYEFD